MKTATWIVTLGIILLMPLCEASQQTGTITQIRKRNSDGLIYFWMSGTRTARPTCATGDYWIIRDETSENGKQQLSMLLLAKATGQQITINGAGSCLRWQDGEDVGEFVL